MRTSPQAVLPETRTWPQYVKDAVRAQDLIVDPPRLVVNAGEAFKNDTGVALRVLQNCGITAFYYKIVGPMDQDMNTADDPTNPTSQDFHGVVAGGTAQDDGLGSIVDLSRFKGRVLIAPVSGNLRVAAFQARGPEMIGLDQ